MLTNDKELKKVIKAAEQQGWTFKRGKKHIKGTHPSGKTTTLSVSPGDLRGTLNAKKILGV